MTERTAKFGIGPVVKHRIFPFRGELEMEIGSRLQACSDFKHYAQIYVRRAGIRCRLQYHKGAALEGRRNRLTCINDK